MSGVNELKVIEVLRSRAYSPKFFDLFSLHENTRHGLRDGMDKLCNNAPLPNGYNYSGTLIEVYNVDLLYN